MRLQELYCKKGNENMYKITFYDKTFVVNDEQDILQAARKQMTKLPYGCANGGCGMCKMYVVDGDYKFKLYSKGALSDDERDEGYILACKTVPTSDMEIELLD